jgi:hypothetical protein
MTLNEELGPCIAAVGYVVPYCHVIIIIMLPIKP